MMSGLADDWDSVFVSREGPVRVMIEARGLRFESVASLRPDKIRRIFERFDPDLIHAHDYRASLAAALLGKPVVSHLHNNYPWAKRLGPITLAYRLALPQFKRIVAVSPSVIEEHFFRRALESRSVVIGNGMDFAQIHFKAREDIPARDLVFVGRLAEQKDPLAFIRIMREIQTPGHPVYGTMLGLGELLEECRQGIVSLQLESLLEMPGYCANPYPTIASSKVCIIPSRWEGFGLVALEAMSLGVAVLGRRVGGLADILAKVSPELLCDSEEQFVTKARELLNDEPKRAGLAAKGKRFVEEEFSLNKFVSKIETVYRESLA